VKITLKKIFSLIIILIFAAFAIIWMYDAITVQADDCSMFYVNRREYITQIYPRLLGIAIPILLIVFFILILLLKKYRLFLWGLSIGLITMIIMSIISTKGLAYWSNPFWRNNVYPLSIDYWLCGFLYLAFFINIIYLCYLFYKSIHHYKQT